MKFWQRLGRKQQNQVLVLATALTVGAYLGLWHLGNYRELNNTENLISRERNRIEARSADEQLPPPAAGLAGELKSARERLDALQQQVVSRQGFFVPLSDTQAIQELRLSISALAESRGVRIQSIEEIGQPQADDANTVLEPSHLEFNLDNPYGRPLLRYTATAGFYNLQRFLIDLGLLSYNVSPVRLGLSAVLAEDAEAEAQVQEQYLDVELVLSL